MFGASNVQFACHRSLLRRDVHGAPPFAAQMLPPKSDAGRVGTDACQDHGLPRRFHLSYCPTQDLPRTRSSPPPTATRPDFKSRSRRQIMSLPSRPDGHRCEILPCAPCRPTHCVFSVLAHERKILHRQLRRRQDGGVEAHGAPLQGTVLLRLAVPYDTVRAPVPMIP